MIRITQRQANIAILGSTTFFLAVLFVTLLAQNTPIELILSLAIAALVFAGLTVAYWYGWESMRYVAVVFLTLMTALSLKPTRLDMGIIVAPVLALVLANAWAVMGSAVGSYLIVLIRGDFSGPFASFNVLFVLLIATIGLILSRLITDAALERAQANADQATAERLRAEQQTVAVSQQAEALAQQNVQQQRLLDLVATLETPAVTIAQGVILAPIVGNVDSERAQTITQRLLQTVYAERTRLVILDIAGVAAVDTFVAQNLIQTANALRLLGCDVTITGISAAVAMTLTQLDIELAGINTAPSPQIALAHYTQRAVVGSR